MTGTYLLRRIGVGSAFKVGAVLGVVLSAILLVPLGLLFLLGGIGGPSEQGLGTAFALGTVPGVLTMICGPLLYGLIYGIVAALFALVYNVIASVAGGVEVTLEAVWKSAPIDRDAVMRAIRGGEGDAVVEGASPPTGTAAPDTVTATGDTGTAREDEQKGGVPSVDDVW